MKKILLLIPLLLTVSARKEKKTTLEDVEQGYVTTKARLSPPPLPKIPSKSPTQFGFVPVKTAVNYAQKEPKITYAQPQYIPENQQYPQYASGLQYTTGPVYTGPVQGSTQETAQKAQGETQAFYTPHGQSQYLNNFENVQFIADNNIEHGSAQQYYSPQQFYYLQQSQAPSTSIQAIVDPKGGLQYIMYIPTYVPSQAADQTQNYENVVYANNEQYQQPQPKYIAYSENQPSYETGKSAYNLKENDFTNKREPKSLLDSYVPSVVQLQYYKQAQLNGIKNSQKYDTYSPITAESSYKYNLKPSPFRR